MITFLTDKYVSFTVRGEPCGKGRPRFSRAGNIIRTYTPEKTVEYENRVKAEYKLQTGSVYLGDKCAVEMKITAYFEVPKSASKIKRKQMLAGGIRPTKKPDADNIVKIIADSLNGLAYRDDAQITQITLDKRYSEDPRVEVIVVSLKEAAELDI